MKKPHSEKGTSKKKSFDIEHKEQTPDIPKQVINPPKESTDPAELLKHA